MLDIRLQGLHSTKGNVCGYTLGAGQISYRLCWVFSFFVFFDGGVMLEWIIVNDIWFALT